MMMKKKIIKVLMNHILQGYEQEKMLSDKRRMDFYYNLIKKYVKASSKMTVLDVGTGTGVLACWSCLAGASKVIAIDHSEKNIYLAATLADNNVPINRIHGWA